jgi:enoyl-CoA hydratase/carnithine racemase
VQSWSLDLEDRVAFLTYCGSADRFSLLAVTELADTLEGSLDPAGPPLVVLTGGEGRFIPDIDRGEFARALDRDPITGDLRSWARATNALESLPQPTVAAIDGPASGGACVLALACTLRLGSERASLGPIEPDLGLVGTDSVKHVMRVAGSAVAADMLLTRSELAASEAKSVGLLNRVFPTDGFPDHARDLCRQVADQPHERLFTIKAAIARHMCASCDGLLALGQRQPGCKCIDGSTELQG